MPERDIVSWNGIICGLAQNGESTKALKLYDKMVQSEPSIVFPIDVMFVGVLGAFSHSGLIKEGYKYLNEMIFKYAIKPKKEHYTCMVDLLGRVGLFNEVEAILRNLPFKPDFVMWGCFVRSLQIAWQSMNGKSNCRPSLYRRTAELFKLLLANTHIDIGGWCEALEVRKAMAARGVQKTVGCSWVDIGSLMHPFIASDKLYPHIETIIETLERF